MNTSILTPNKWGMIFILLSLDIMYPLWEYMGLHLRDKENFKSLLRHLIIENRSIYEQNPNETPPLVDRVFEQVETKIGKNEAKSLYEWATNIYNEVHADSPQWSAWEIIFFRATNNALVLKELGIPEKKLEILLPKYKEYMDTSDVDKQIEKLKEEPLSDWDLEMYSIHQFCNNGLSDPFELIYRSVRMYYFQLFWKDLLSELSVKDKATLLQNGKAIIKNMGVWMPENVGLRFPDNS